MAKSKARFLSELLGSTGLVKKSKSELAGADEILDLDTLPTIPNSKLQNSSISIAGHSTALGGSVTLDTADIGEHINYKYYTDARARGAVSVSGDLAYNSTTGVFSFTERTDAEVRGLVSATGSLSYNSTTGVMSFTMPAQNTSNITEGTNLYFTNARADARIAAASTSDLSEGTNLYYTDARARSAISATGSLSYNSTTGVFSYTTPTTIASLSNHDTADLAEGTNLYYTDARADARIAAASTSDLSEGTNLYYTDARADARVALIVDSAPGTLNTLNELAAALGDDANFSTTVTNSIATKLPLAGGTLTGTLAMGANAITSTGTISSGAITSTGDISANSGKVRMGNPTLLSGRSSIRIDSDGDSFADLVFGDNVTSTSWANANWAISSRSSSESNSLKIFRATGQPSPYNSEHVLMEFKQNNVVSVNSTLQINNTTVIDSSRNLTAVTGTFSGVVYAGTRVEIQGGGGWAYTRLQDSTSVMWDIAANPTDNSSALQFRPAGNATNATLMSTAGHWTMAGNITAGGAISGASIASTGSIISSGNIETTSTSIGVTQSDGDFLARLYQSAADGALDLNTGEATPVNRIRLHSYNDSYINPASGGLAVGKSTVTSGYKLDVDGALQVSSDLVITAGQITVTNDDHNYLRIESAIAREQMVRFKNSSTNYWYAGLRTSGGLATTADFHIYSAALGNDVLALKTDGSMVVAGGATFGGAVNGVNLAPSASGSRWGVTAEVASNGVMEVGRYIDFHATNADTSDYGARLDFDGTNLIVAANASFTGNILQNGYLKADSTTSNRFGGDTFSGSVGMYDNVNSAYQTPVLVIRKDSTQTGNVSTAPVSLFIHNGVGKWVKLSLGARETDAAGNTVSIAGIASERTSGTVNAWATGNLHLWTKSANTQIINQTLKSNGDTEIPSGNLEVRGNVTLNHTNSGNKYLTLNKANGGDGHILFQENLVYKWQNVTIGTDLQWYSYTQNGPIVKFGGTGGINLLYGGYEIAGTTVIDSSRNLTNIGAISGTGNITTRAANVVIDAQSSADGQTVGFRAGYQAHTTLAGYFRYTTGDAQLYIDNNFVGNNAVYSNINFRNKANGGSSLINRLTIHGSTGHVNITGGALQMGGTTVIDSSRNIDAVNVQAAGGINLRRDLGPSTGISFYTPTYYNWQVYMAAAGATSCGANGNLTAPSGLAGVTSWALRSRMEGVSTYGWIWETGASGGGDATATAKMSLQSTTGNLQIAGSFTAGANITAYSDERLKDNIKTLDGSKVLEMRGVSFTKDGKAGSGVIAQELERIAPELVEDDGTYKSVAYGNLVGYLIENAKEQQKEIDELKSLVKQLIAN